MGIGTVLAFGWALPGPRLRARSKVRVPVYDPFGASIVAQGESSSDVDALPSGRMQQSEYNPRPELQRNSGRPAQIPLECQMRVECQLMAELPPRRHNSAGACHLSGPQFLVSWRNGATASGAAMAPWHHTNTRRRVCIFLCCRFFLSIPKYVFIVWLIRNDKLGGSSKARKKVGRKAFFPFLGLGSLTARELDLLALGTLHSTRARSNPRTGSVSRYLLRLFIFPPRLSAFERCAPCCTCLC